MTIHRLPFLTISLLTFVTGLYWLAPDKSPLYFSANYIAQGEIWRIVTGHFTHADLQHLSWNGLGLAVLGMMIERHSRLVLMAAIGAGIVSVNALLLGPFPKPDFYCGLSGVLNTLLLVALWLEWRASRSRMLPVIACCCVAKALIEALLGTSLVTDISWPPYAWSHVAGLIGGLIIVRLQSCYNRSRKVDEYTGLPIFLRRSFA